MNMKQIDKLSTTGVVNVYFQHPSAIKMDFPIVNASPEIRSDWLIGEGTTTFMQVQPGARMVTYDLVHETAQKRRNALRELAKY